MLRSSIRSLPIALAATLVLTAAGHHARPADAAGPGYSFTVVASLGGAAPGGGTHEGDFEPQTVNGRGDATFASDMSSGGEGLFLRHAGVTSQLARSGDPAPGTGLDFGYFGVITPSALNDAGNAAFGFSLDVPFTQFGTNFGLFRYSAASGTVTPALLPGQAAPGSTTFRGIDWHTGMNNKNEIVTTAIIDTTQGHCTVSTAPCYGLGRGIYTLSADNVASKVAAPGDPAPGASALFDDAWDPDINDRGDVVFGGHVAGELCGDDYYPDSIGCVESLYLYRASTGQVSSLVHRGDAAPGGGSFDIAFNGQLNNTGDMSFIGVLASGNGVFLRDRDGALTKIAGPGDSLPGGTMANTSYSQGTHSINGAGNVAFVAQLTADANADGFQDTGVYCFDHGSISTVVRTGTVIPGLGTVAHVENGYTLGSPYPWTGISLNDRGQVLTQVIMADGGVYTIIATP